VMRPAGGKLSLELHHECGKTINGIGWEFDKPAKGCSLQRCRKHSPQHCIVRGVETHMGDIDIHMLVRVSRHVVSVSVETLPLSGSGSSMIVLLKGCRRAESTVTVVLADLLRKDSPSILWVGILSLVSFAGLGLGGEVKDLPTTLVDPVDGPPSISFFFISSFSLQRACISCPFFWTTSSVLLFISTISLCRDNNILSMLLVEIIYFLSLASFSWPHGGCQLFLLGRWDLENY